MRKDVGADAILSITPYYNKPTQEGLYQHYKAIASSVEIPLCFYNVPGRTGVDLQAETVVRLLMIFQIFMESKKQTGSLERAISLISQRKDLVVVSG